MSDATDHAANLGDLLGTPQNPAQYHWFNTNGAMIVGTVASTPA